MKTHDRKGEWWKSFYEDTPFHLYLERHDPEELAATIRFLIEKLHLVPGARLFDQCCGMGSLSIPMAQQGFSVVGVDLCESFIARAKSLTADGSIPAEFFVGNAFQFVPARLCDAAFNWYTSFGYSTEDDENFKMIQRAFEAIKPGGWFALDFPNVPMIRKNFQSTMTRTLNTPGGQISIVRECEIDDESGLMMQRWTWTLPDQRVIKSDSNLRVYMPDELVNLFNRAGFTEAALYGGLAGEPLTEDSGRLLCVGRKPL